MLLVTRVPWDFKPRPSRAPRATLAKATLPTIKTSFLIVPPPWIHNISRGSYVRLGPPHIYMALHIQSVPQKPPLNIGRFPKVLAYLHSYRLRRFRNDYHKYPMSASETSRHAFPIGYSCRSTLSYFRIIVHSWSHKSKVRYLVELPRIIIGHPIHFVGTILRRITLQSNGNCWWGLMVLLC